MLPLVPFNDVSKLVLNSPTVVYLAKPKDILTIMSTAAVTVTRQRARVSNVTFVPRLYFLRRRPFQSVPLTTVIFHYQIGPWYQKAKEE
jgi:hypothetical protein